MSGSQGHALVGGAAAVAAEDGAEAEQDPEVGGGDDGGEGHAGVGESGVGEHESGGPAECDDEEEGDAGDDAAAVEVLASADRASSEAAGVVEGAVPVEGEGLLGGRGCVGRGVGGGGARGDADEGRRAVEVDVESQDRSVAGVAQVDEHGGIVARARPATSGGLSAGRKGARFGCGFQRYRDREG